MTAPEGLRRRRLSTAALVVLGAAGLLFTGLAVASAVSHGRPWIIILVSPVLTGVLVWLIVRGRARRTPDALPDGVTAARVDRIVVSLGLAGLALIGLALYLIGG